MRDEMREGVTGAADGQWRAKRIALEVPALLEVSGYLFQCETVDLSEAGIAVRSRVGLLDGVVARVIFRPPGSESVLEVEGRLARRRRSGSETVWALLFSGKPPSEVVELLGARRSTRGESKRPRAVRRRGAELRALFDEALEGM